MRRGGMTRAVSCVFSVLLAAWGMSGLRSPEGLEPAGAATAGKVRLATTRTADGAVESYLTGFSNSDADAATFTMRMEKAGLYLVVPRYRAQGPKAYNLTVAAAGKLEGSALTYSGLLERQWPEFGLSRLPVRVELREGVNELRLAGGWGYYEIAGLQVEPTEPPPLVLPQIVPCDPQASAEARALLQTLGESYGKRCLSGVYSPADSAYVLEKTGVRPAILGGDLMDYSPSRIERGTKPQEVEELIAGHKAGQLITLSWHWNAPSGLIDRMDKDENGREVNKLWYKGFNTNATTFDVEKALADETGADYALLIRDIDAIAVQLKRLEAAGVPLLWRPLHEAEGRWFWWGAKGPEPLKKLWRLMHDRLTRHHNLHNLIWVFTAGPGADWYPGDEVVDIVGIDAYPQDVRDPLTNLYDAVLQQVAGRKMVALSEVGGVPDIERMRRHGVHFCYFASWSGELGPRKMSDAALKAIYASPAVVNAPDR